MLRVLPLPFVLFFLSQESDFGRLPLGPPVFLDSLEVAIDLDFVEGSLFIFAVSLLESGYVPLVVPPTLLQKYELINAR
jgi:hypothetical protein